MQKYIESSRHIPLDIFKDRIQNKGITNKLEAWLTFLSQDEPETIFVLCEKYPEFKEIYEQLYDMCLNTERVMGMFSKELLELDRNTVQYMIDEMQEEINRDKDELARKDREILRRDDELLKKDAHILRAIKNLQAAGFSADEAMDMLGIAGEDKEYFDYKLQ